MKRTYLFVLVFCLVSSFARGQEPVSAAATEELAELRRQNRELSVHVRNVVADRQVVQDRLKVVTGENESLRKKDALRRGELAVLKKAQIALVRKVARLERANTFCQQKEARSAERVVPQALKRENADLHYNLGVVFQEQKRYDAAAREFGLAVKANPGDRDAHFNLALVYDRGQNNRSAAIRHYREYLRLAADSADAAKVRERLAVLEAEQKVWGQPFAAGLDDREKLGRP